MGSLKLTLRVPRAREDELVAELWALGTAGVHVRSALGEGNTEDRGEVILDAYFDEKTRVRKEDLRGFGEPCDAILVEAVEVESRDWLASYREQAEPMRIGPFLIDPREPEPAPIQAIRGQAPISAQAETVVAEDPGNRCLSPSTPDCRLRIPARNAFGTGSHESTRLLLEELGEADLAGRTVLDVGTGSGILAFAALRRGARFAVAFDPDVGSVITARDNARLNGLTPCLFGGRIDAVAGSFDVVLVNILPHRWLGDAAQVVAALRPGGSLFVSGLLEAEREDVMATQALAGLELAASRTLGEWSSLRLVRPRTAAD
jgi:ribosomal protein L11 methylase PrmA